MLDKVMAQLWQMSWQAAAAAVFVVLLQAVFRPALSPRWRHALWLLVLGRLLIPVLPVSHISLFGAIDRPDALQSISTPPLTPPGQTTVSIHYGPSAGPSANLATNRPDVYPRRSASWTPLVIARFIWVGGAMLVMTRLFLVNLRFARRLTGCAASPELTLILAECCREIRLARRPDLLITDKIESPAVAGMLRPRILLPLRLSLSNSQLRLVLLHELTHIQCHDVAIDWLWSILQSLHWFNPILWLIAPLRRNDREQARDAMVLQIIGPHQTDAYGQTLLNLSQSSSLPIFCPGLVGILSGKRRLQRRIEMIVDFRGHSRMKSAIGLALLVITGCSILTSPAPRQPAVSAHSHDVSNAKSADDLDQPSAETAAVLAKLNERADDDTLVTRYYDVNDLMFVAPDYDTPSHAENAEQKMSPTDLRTKRLKDLVTYIEDNVAVSTWKDRGGNIGTIGFVPGGDALDILQTRQNHADIQSALNDLRHGRGLQMSVKTQLLMISENEVSALPEDVKRRLAALSGAGRYRTDQLITESERQQIASSLVKCKSTNSLTAPRLTLFDGQHASMFVTTQQAYVDSLARATKTEGGRDTPWYQPHTATVNATGLEFHYAVCASPSHDVAFVESHIKYSKLIALLTEHWPDAPVNVEADVQRPVTVDYERSLTCAIPKGMSLLLAGFVQTVTDCRTVPSVPNAARANQSRAIDSAIDVEKHNRLYLLITPTILEDTTATAK